MPKDMDIRDLLLILPPAQFLKHNLQPKCQITNCYNKYSMISLLVVMILTKKKHHWVSNSNYILVHPLCHGLDCSIIVVQIVIVVL